VVIYNGSKHSASEQFLYGTSAHKRPFQCHPNTAATFSANHFAVLHPTAESQQIGNFINLTEAEETIVPSGRPKIVLPKCCRKGGGGWAMTLKGKQ